MDYEKKYNKLVEAIKVLQETNPSDKGIQNWVNDNVPELADSKDEKIRKAIHIYLDWLDGRKDCAPKGEYSIKDMIAWLEKQNEFKNIDSDDLATLEIWKNAIKENKGKWQLSDWFIEATSLLIQKVKRIENNPNKKPQRIVSAEAKEAMYDKPAWSEEDEYMLSLTSELLNYHLQCRKWLKSLKGRVQQPKQEWSKEDENHIQHISDFILRNRVGDTDAIYRLEQDVNWLKSLRPQHRWKPSDEQLEALRIAAEIGTANNSWAMDVLKCVYQYLKKLREE